MVPRTVHGSESRQWLCESQAHAGTPSASLNIEPGSIFGSTFTLEPGAPACAWGSQSD